MSRLDDNRAIVQAYLKYTDKTKSNKSDVKKFMEWLYTHQSAFKKKNKIGEYNTLTHEQQKEFEEYLFNL